MTKRPIFNTASDRRAADNAVIRTSRENGGKTGGKITPPEGKIDNPHGGLYNATGFPDEVPIGSE
jgi:hypothetical protein